MSPDVSVRARAEMRTEVLDASSDFDARFTFIITFNAKFNTKEINCPAELRRNKQSRRAALSSNNYVVARQVRELLHKCTLSEDESASTRRWVQTAR